MGTICQNSFREHPLIVIEKKVNDSASYFAMNIDSTSCSACGEPCLDKTFACLKCKYYFHESCLELPHEIQHSFHPFPLSLRQATIIFRCRACKENRTQFAYHCDKCHFYLDVECALMFTGIFEGQNYILNYYDQHPLILCNKEKERNDHVVSCDGCNQVIYGEIYGCLHCNFYLHGPCATGPRQIKHLLHPEHSLPLFYDDNWWCKLSILKAWMRMGK